MTTLDNRIELGKEQLSGYLLCGCRKEIAELFDRHRT